jgi:putative transposase
VFGCARFAYNSALAHTKKEYEENQAKFNYSELSRRLTEQKKQPETSWLKEVSSVALQQALKDLEQAFKNFFASLKGARKGKKLGFPKFKKRTSAQSIRLTSNAFKVHQHKIYLAKIGKVKINWGDRKLPSTPSSCTVIKDASGRYFLSFVVEVEPQILIGGNEAVGVDLGIIDFATTSMGEKVKSPKPLKKNLKRLAKAQRQLSRKQKGSKRREKAKKRVAKIHAKIGDTRLDFLHKLSTKLIRENQTVVLEDLNVSGLVKNRKLARAISDLGWRTFRTMLEAKAAMYGRKVRIINRWEPTSQKCSCCGFKGGKKELNVREWQCLNCGVTHDRDVNAAQNIKLAGGQSDSQNARGGSVRPASKLAVSGETRTHQESQQLSFFELLLG